MGRELVVLVVLSLLFLVLGETCCERNEIKVNGFDEAIKVSEDYDYTKRLRKFAEISLLNTKIYTSVRRFEKNGRIRTAIKIFLIGLYINFIGNVKKNIFNYRFNEK